MCKIRFSLNVPLLPDSFKISAKLKTFFKCGKKTIDTTTNLETFLEVLSVKPVNVLYKWLKTFYFDPQLLKAQTKYLGRNWRKSNMKTMSAIYQKVRHRLNDDWAYGNGMRLWQINRVHPTGRGNRKHVVVCVCVCVCVCVFWGFFLYVLTKMRQGFEY